MRSLVLLIATSAFVSGLRNGTPGFAAEFRLFGDSSIYQQQRLPDRDQARSFRDTTQPSVLHLQSFREDAFREYRQPFGGRDHKSSHQEARGDFKEDPRPYEDRNRRPLEGNLRSFDVDSRSFRDENRIYKEDTRVFREDRPFREEPRTIHEGPRQFREERPYREERRYREERPYREELRHYRNELRPFREESRQFRDEIHQFEGPRTFSDEYRPFKEDIRHFRDERLFKENVGPYGSETGPFREPRPLKEESGPYSGEPRPFKEESGPYSGEPRPFKEESGPYNGEPRPFKEESGPYSGESRPMKDGSGAFSGESRPFKDGSGAFSGESRPFRDERPFREEPRPFKDELLFTEESQSLADAQNRFNKEQQQRQPLSFGGHSNYLKFGNHGLGFASVPAAILPLDDDTSQRISSGSTVSTASTPQSPDLLTSVAQATSSPYESVDSKSQNTVTLPPVVRSTPGQSTSGNAIDSDQRKNENLFGGGPTSSASTAATISTSVGPNPTPKVVFGTGSASISSTSIGINGAVRADGIQPTNTPSANSVHDSNTSHHVVEPPRSYYQSAPSTEVPAALLNYIFKYQMPEDTKAGYTYRQPLPTESFANLPNVPLVQHHQTAKYAILPEFKIPEVSQIRQPVGTINYVSPAQLPKVSFLNGNQQAIALGTSYSTESLPTANYPRGLIQLDRGNQFPHLGQINLQQLGQTEHFPQYRQLAPVNHVTRLGEYGQFGQTEQPRRNPFGQGGLQLELGGFGGIDYSALTSNSGGSRGSQQLGLDIGKVGLSLQEPARAPAPSFPKISFGQPLW